jgi:ribosomal subunit interface protein
VDIVVKGRNVEVPDHYRQHVADKLAKIERYDQKLIRVEVELSHERNPRQSDYCQRVEITCVSRGPVIRAEARAADFYSALDVALDKIDNRLRRAADRRRVHRGRRTPVSVAEAMAAAAFDPRSVDRRDPAKGMPVGTGAGATTALLEQDDEGLIEADDQPWHIVRMKEHPGEPMTVDDALFHMELLGHDFYLFNDKESGQPSVVYRRRGYDYGVISLAR